jgi:hypothetical protein
MSDDLIDRTAASYQAFAVEASGRSPQYEELARAVATAVLGYVRRADRAGFARAVRDLRAVWLSNEGADVLPGIVVREHDAHGFVLVKDGTVPIAVTDSHGTWLEWLS